MPGQEEMAVGMMRMSGEERVAVPMYWNNHPTGITSMFHFFNNNGNNQ